MKRRHKPAPRPARPIERRQLPPGIQYAMTMASAQFEAEKAARKIIATDKVVDELQRAHMIATENWMYGLMALALHDEGFGAKRILRVCEKIRDWHRELNSEEFSDFDLWGQVAKETGLAFDPDNDTMKRIEA